MTAGIAMLVLRLLHILAGAAWVGMALFVGGFLIPALRAIGPAGGPVMQQIGQVRRLPAWIMTVALLTVASGFGLYWRDSVGFSSAEWLGSGMGRTMGAGGIVALIAMIYGMTVVSPMGKRMAALADAMQQAGGPPPADRVAEMQRLQARMGKASVVVGVVLVLATSLMAVARYVV